MRPLKHYTLVMLSSAVDKATAESLSGSDQVSWLLGYKKRGFGLHKWNGFGGKIEQGESARQAAVREFKEECGIDLAQDAIAQCGQLHFAFEGKPVDMLVHVFRAHTLNGRQIYQPVESDEMLPRWFEQSEIPYAKMWPDDEYWWPYMIRNQKFQGFFQYNDGENILHHHIRKCETFDTLCPAGIIECT